MLLLPESGPTLKPVGQHVRRHVHDTLETGGEANTSSLRMYLDFYRMTGMMGVPGCALSQVGLLSPNPAESEVRPVTGSRM